MKPLLLRAAADGDIRQAMAYYRENAPQQALAFIDAVEEAFQHIRRHPGSGSPRYAHDLGLPGLRFWICRRFPYLVFYMERQEAIEVWRVLHGSRDIPPSLQADTPEQ
jgi:toxin ParE1/3/4